jgi:cytochrome c
MPLMDKMTINMIAGGILSSLLVIFGMNTLVDIVYPKGGAPEPEVESAAHGGPAAGSAPAAASKPIGVLLASADPKAGEVGAKKCATCHTFESGGPNKVGPNLHGIIGRPVGKHEGFSYSPAMAGHGGNWDYELLNCYLHDPKSCIPGNKMAFAGLKKDGERADVIAYLRTITDNPPPLPAADAAAQASPPTQAEGAPAKASEATGGSTAPGQPASSHAAEPGTGGAGSTQTPPANQ